jgi:hypothetical protein
MNRRKILPPPPMIRIAAEVKVGRHRYEVGNFHCRRHRQQPQLEHHVMD